MALFTQRDNILEVITDDEKYLFSSIYQDAYAELTLFGEQTAVEPEEPTDPEEPGPDPEPTGGFTAPLPRSMFANTWDTDFGPRPGVGVGYHRGIDFGVGGAAGRPVRATASGTVTQVWRDSRIGYWGDWTVWRGNAVLIDHGSRDGGGEYDGWRVLSLYCHMRDAPLVAVGDRVAAGKQLGIVGATGQTFGAHLHWELHRNSYNDRATAFDPVPFIAAWGNNWGF